MKNRWTAAVACMLVVAATACAKTDSDEGVTADTSLVPGTETVDVPTNVPTTDTVIRRTETDTDVDTIEGEARDTIKH
jgi:hypothetical protein